MFSICIPNYNYAHYLPKTLKSIFAQTLTDYEVVVADNCSSDASVKVIEGFGDDRVQVKVNQCNVGFSRNLDMAASMATRTHMIMLSSDDRMRFDALESYSKILSALPESERTKVVVCSRMNQIDPNDVTTGTLAREERVWDSMYFDQSMSNAFGLRVYRAPAAELLQRALKNMINPFPFASTCYPKGLYEKLEGYGSGRMINPDKWFHWRLLNVAEEAIFIDDPLFDYRWHPSNQSAQQAASGALKYLADEYASTLEVSNDMLEQAQMSRVELEKAFVEHDIINHGLATLGRGNTTKARRIYNYGKATYPQHLRNNRRAALFSSLLKGGSLGRAITARAYKWASSR